MINEDRTIQIFNSHCVVAGDTVRLYGQYQPEAVGRWDARKFRLVDKGSGTRAGRVRLCGKKRDFCIILPYSQSWQQKSYCFAAGEKVVFEQVRLGSPFEKDRHRGEDSAIIVTMVRNYANRIREWIEYHLNMGFSKIVVFNNNSTDGTREVIEGMNDERAVVIPFDYTCFEGFIYDEIQRMAMSIGSSAFRDSYGWTCLIDADEFVCIPGMKPMDIRAFLGGSKYRRRRAIAMQSIVLTNRGESDEIDNNVIDLCRYSDMKGLYTKVLVNNRRARKVLVIKSPHRFRGQRNAGMDEIYHCHCWCNERLAYGEHFEQRNELVDSKNGYRREEG